MPEKPQETGERQRDHVVLVGSRAKCLNCGAAMEISLPVRVTDWCNALNSFSTQHRSCLPLGERVTGGEKL